MTLYYEVNIATGEKTLIPENEIVNVTEDYIIVSSTRNNAAARMITNFLTEEVEEKNTSIELKQNNIQMLPEESETGVRKYIYNVGIDKIKIEKRLPQKICGHITNDINIGTCSYIELSVKRNNTSVPVEFYIIDGLNETPILPLEETVIENEQLFVGQDIRFTPDPNKAFMIKKNGVETSMTRADFLEMKDINAEDSYTADYTPIAKAYKYVPKNKSIKIKIIERCFGKVPSVISALVIKKHGGEKIWNI